MPTLDQLKFNRRIYLHKNSIIPAIVDHGAYPLNEFVKDILPALKDKKDLKIKNRGITGFKPEDELSQEAKPVDQKLLDAIEYLVKKIGTGYVPRITVLPEREYIEYSRDTSKKEKSRFMVRLEFDNEEGQGK